MLTRWVPLDEARDGLFSGDLHSPLCVMGILAVTGVLLDGVASTSRSSRPGFAAARP